MLRSSNEANLSEALHIYREATIQSFKRTYIDRIGYSKILTELIFEDFTPLIGTKNNRTRRVLHRIVLFLAHEIAMMYTKLGEPYLTFMCISVLEKWS